jgi:hypothetical protein
MLVFAGPLAGAARAQTNPSGSGSSTDLGTPSGNMNDMRDRSAVPPPPPDTMAAPPAAPATVTPPPAGPSGMEVQAPPATAPGGPAPAPQNPADVPDVSAAAANSSVTESVPVEPLPPLMPPGSRAHPYSASRIGGALLVGGGYEDFTNNAVNRMTSAGGSWNARVVAGTRQYVGIEGAYVGAARSIDGLGLSNDATLIANGVEGNLRVNIPIARNYSLVEPFGFVGLGWSRYHVGNTQTTTSDVNTNDDIMAVPFGAGLEYAYKAFMADARFTYRQTYYNDLLRTGGGNLNNWGVGGQIGFSY